MTQQKNQKPTNSSDEIKKKERDLVLDAVAAVGAVFATSEFAGNLAQQLHEDKFYPFKFVSDNPQYFPGKFTYSFAIIYVTLLLIMLILINFAKKQKLDWLFGIVLTFLLCGIFFIYTLTK